MPLMDKILPGKNKDELLCGNCRHLIIQSLDTGKWFHAMRDTNNDCFHFDAKTNQQCSCSNAIPFVPSNKPTPQQAVVQPEVEIKPIEKQVVNNVVEEENPVNYILRYLLETKSYTVSDANLVIDVVKKLLIDTVKTQ